MEHLTDKADDKMIILSIIQLNKNTELNADKRNKEIKELITSAMNENYRTDISHDDELPFEIVQISYESNKIEKAIQYTFQFKLSKLNYKVVPDALYVVTESPSDRWCFANCTYFGFQKSKAYLNVAFNSDLQGIRKIESSGMVFFVKIYDRTNYYIRLFGKNNEIFYERLTCKEYDNTKKRYNEIYNNAMKYDSSYEQWSKYHSSVMYTDFGSKV